MKQAGQQGTVNVPPPIPKSTIYLGNPEETSKAMRRSATLNKIIGSVAA